MKVNPAYLAVLEEELADAKRRQKRASREGLPIVNQQIREIERDIARYSAIERDSRKMGTPGNPGESRETRREGNVT